MENRESSPIVRFEGAGRRVRSAWLVRDLDLAIPTGSMFALIGKSGAGKTTTLRLLLGLLPPTTGRVEVLGGPARYLHRHAGRLGAVLDRVALHPSLSVAHNLRAHARMHGRSAARLRHWLEALDLGPLEHRKASRLSQGERQRVSLARALLLEPELLVLDEPLVHLDPASSNQTLELLIDQVRDRGTTVVLSSHHLAHVERAADRIAFLHEGQILMEGALEELLAAREPWYRVATDSTDRAKEILRDHPVVQDLRDGEHAEELRVLVTDGRAGDVNAALHDAGLKVSLLAPEDDSLDAVFLQSIARAEKQRA